MRTDLARYVDIERTVNYLSTRRHPDGGYCFARYLDETNINDTYYAVKTLKLLGEEIPDVEKTIEFLRAGIQKQTAVVAIAMAIDGLAALGADDLAEEKLELIFMKYNPSEGKFAVGLGGSEEFGTATPLEATYWVVKAMSAINYKFDEDERDAIRRFIMRFRMGDAYGVKQPTTTMTYQALFSLRTLGYRPPRTSHFRKVEVCGDFGGFTEVPFSLPPYLEPTFYALRGMQLQGEKVSCFNRHVWFIKTLQNPNGGFRRSIELGISNFQNTYRALASLDVLLKMG